MIQYKVWFKKINNSYGKEIRCRFEGWLLFGFLPLYTKQIEYPIE